MLGTIGAVLGFAGYSSLFFGVLPSDAAALAAAQTGVDKDTTTQILDQMAAHPSAAIALMLFVIGHILGTVCSASRCRRGGWCRPGRRWR